MNRMNTIVDTSKQLLKIILLVFISLNLFVLELKAGEIKWSDNPGCFERHLQRRYKNILFPESRRIVTINEVLEARALDKADAEALSKECLDLAKKITKLPSFGTIQETFVIIEEIEKLLKRAAEVGGGGNVVDSQEMLLNLRKAIIESVKKAIGNNAEALKGLEEPEKVWHENFWIYYNPFVAQMNRSDTPITGADMIPSTLSEEPETIKAVLSAMDKKEFVTKEIEFITKIIKKAMINLLMSLRSKGINDKFINERLAVLQGKNIDSTSTPAYKEDKREWEVVTTVEDGSKYLVDKKNIEYRPNGFFRIWRKNILSTTSSSEMSEMTVLFEVDCTNSKYRMIHFDSIDRNGKKESVDTPFINPPYDWEEMELADILLLLPLCKESIVSED